MAPKTRRIQEVNPQLPTCTHPVKRRCGICTENYCTGCDQYHLDACRDANRP